MAGPLLQLLFRLKDSLSERAAEFTTRFELRWCIGFDDRFEQFWNELSGHNRNVLVSTRNRETMRWHFKSALDEERVWILSAYDGPRLVAYAVFERKETQSVDLTKVVLIDFQALVKDSNLCSSMISCALQRCRREGVPVLENVGCWLEAVQPLANRTMFRRRLGGWCFLYQTSNPVLARALQNAESWYPTHFDADGSL